MIVSIILIILSFIGALIGLIKEHRVGGLGKTGKWILGILAAINIFSIIKEVEENTEKNRLSEQNSNDKKKLEDKLNNQFQALKDAADHQAKSDAQMQDQRRQSEAQAKLEYERFQAQLQAQREESAAQAVKSEQSSKKLEALIDIVINGNKTIEIQNIKNAISKQLEETTKQIQKNSELNSYVTLYKGYNFVTSLISVKINENIPDFDNTRNGDFDNKISSIKYNIASGWRAVLYSDDKYRGAVIVLKGNGEIGDLKEFNDRSSSIQWIKD